MSLDDDEKLILQNDQTLRAAGVGKNLSLAENCSLQSESERKESDSGFKWFYRKIFDFIYPRGDIWFCSKSRIQTRHRKGPSLGGGGPTTLLINTTR